MQKDQITNENIPDGSSPAQEPDYPKKSSKAYKLIYALGFAIMATAIFLDDDYQRIYGNLKFVLIYLSLICVLLAFDHRPAIKKTVRLLAFPLILLMGIAPILASIFSINMMLSIAIAASASTAVYLLPMATGTPLPDHTQLYIATTLLAIILTTFGNRLIRFNLWLEDKPYRQFSEDLALHTFNEKKIRYMIYFLYFLILIYFNVSPAFHMEADSKLSTAILQSFATYLAYDRLVSNAHLLKSTPKKRAMTNHHHCPNAPTKLTL